MTPLALALGFALAGSAANAGAQTFVGADVEVDTTWGGGANPSPIILEQPIFVTSGATLTILPGTIVRGQPRTAVVTPGSVVGSPGALLVTNNGRIVASGDKDNPITFTTAAVDNDNDGVADDDNLDGFDDAYVMGDAFLDDDPTGAPLAPLDADGEANVSKWGGIVILGNAPTNLADASGVGFGKATVEGLTIPGFPVAFATYGGDQPHDNSGILRYVSIRHAGDEVGESNELNGLTLAGVGDGTVIEFVEIYCNFDDGVEWFGGTTNGNNLAVFFAGDDQFDLDQGFTGVQQELLAVMPFFNENDGDNFGSASGDKACECDGDDAPNVARGAEYAAVPDGSEDLSDRCAPLTTAQLWNATVVGSSPDQDGTPCFTPTSVAGDNRGFQVRNGYAGRIFNSIVVNTGGAKGYDTDDDTGSGCQAGPSDVIDLIGAGYVALVSSTLDDSAGNSGLDAGEMGAIANGNALNASIGGTANVVASGLFPGLEQEDQSFNPVGVTTCPGASCGKLDPSLKPDASGVCSPLDPRPGFGLVGTAGGVPGASKLLRPITYRGAFDRTDPEIWTTGWTALNQGGILAD